MPLSKLFTTKPDKPPPPPEPTRAEKLVASVQPGAESDTPYAAELIKLYGKVPERHHRALCQALEVVVLLVAELPAPFTEDPYGFLRRQLQQAHDGLAEINRLQPWSVSYGNEQSWQVAAIIAGLGTGLEDVETARVGDGSYSGTWSPIMCGLSRIQPRSRVEWGWAVASSPGYYSAPMLIRHDIRKTLGPDLVRQLWSFFVDPADASTPLGQAMQSHVGTGYAAVFFTLLRGHIQKNATQHNRWPGLTWVTGDDVAVALPWFVRHYGRNPSSPVFELTEAEILRRLRQDRIIDIRAATLAKDTTRLDVIMIPILRVFPQGTRHGEHQVPGLTITINNTAASTQGCPNGTQAKH